MSRKPLKSAAPAKNAASAKPGAVPLSPSRSGARLKPSTLWILAGLLLLGLLMRAYRYDYTALHHDEAYSINGILTPTWAALKSHLQHIDLFPPLIYLIQKGVYAFAPSIGAMRLISVAAGVATIGIAFWALLPLLRQRRALLLAGLCTSSYFLIWYAREVRAYAFHFAAVFLTTGFLIRLALATAPKPPLKLLAGFLLGSALGIHFHYNMLLTWPLMGLLFLWWEFVRYRQGHPFRWSYVLGLAAAGAVALLTMLPFLPLFMKGILRPMGDNPAVRPTLELLYTKFACTGWGTGWLGILWCALIAAGFYRAFRVNQRAFALMATFVPVAILVYLYLLGLPPNFANNLQKYLFVFSIGILVAVTYGLEQASHTLHLLIVRLTHCRIRILYLNLTLLVVLPLLALPVWHRYYNLQGASYLFKELTHTLTSLGPRNVLLDNYYEMMYSRHYLPDNARLAHPPVYGSNAEYEKLGAAPFMKNLLTQDPLFVYWDACRRFCGTNTDWSWLGPQFAHCATLYNTNGVFLNRRALNFHPFEVDPTGDMRPPHIYYNTLADLPDWFRRHNLEFGTAFGANWYHLTHLGLDNQWRHQYIATDRATFYVCNATTSATPVQIQLRFTPCAPNQTISVYMENQCIARHLAPGRPIQGVDLRTQQRFQQPIPLGTLCRSAGGMLSLPVALQIDFATMSVTNLLLPVGTTPFTIASSMPDGVVVGGITVRKE